MCIFSFSYFSALDKQFCAVVCNKSDLKDELQNQSSCLIVQLKAAGFGFFMYGALAWENSRRDILPQNLVDFIKEHHPTFLGSHTCIDCFQNTENCAHPCCINKAKDFALRVGLKVVEKAASRKIGI